VNIGASVTTPTGRPGILVCLLYDERADRATCAVVRVVCWPKSEAPSAHDFIYRRQDVREARD
jgi:hypothetical protein